MPGILVTGFVALSIHVISLNYLKVPYPDGYPRAGWPLLLSLCLQTFALLEIYELAHGELQLLRWSFQVAVLFTLSCGLRESLRAFLMNGWVTTAWRFNAVSDLPSFLTGAYLAFAAVILGSRRLALRWRFASSIGVGLALSRLVPITASAIDQITSKFSYLSHDALWTPPYDWHVQVPAYITYLEPTLSCFFLAMLLWDSLPSRKSLRIVSFACVVMAVDGSLTKPFIYPFFSKLPRFEALISQGQFFLEHLALAVLTGLFWSWSKAGADRTVREESKNRCRAEPKERGLEGKTPSAKRIVAEA